MFVGHTFLGLHFVTFAKWPVTPRELKSHRGSRCSSLHVAQVLSTFPNLQMGELFKKSWLAPEGVPWPTPTHAHCRHHVWPPRGCGASFFHGPHQHTNLFLPLSRLYTGFFYYNKFYRHWKEKKYITNDVKLARFLKPYKFHSVYQRVYLEPK